MRGVIMTKVGKINEVGYKIILMKYDKKTKKSDKFSFGRSNQGTLKTNKDCYLDACNILSSLRECVDDLKWVWNLEYEIYDYASRHERCSSEMEFVSETEKYNLTCRISCKI